MDSHLAIRKSMITLELSRFDIRKTGVDKSRIFGRSFVIRLCSLETNQYTTSSVQGNT